MGNQDFNSFGYKVSLVTDFSADSPKLRLSALGYLLDNGFLNHGFDITDLLEYANAFVNFVTENNDSFIEALEKLESGDVPDDLSDLFNNSDDEGPQAGGYL